MNEINGAVSTGVFQTIFTLRDTENDSKPQHSHTLNEVQRRAYHVHQRHGAIYGGYTLEDWLEAEHELEEEDSSPSPRKDQIH